MSNLFALMGGKAKIKVYIIIISKRDKISLPRSIVERAITKEIANKKRKTKLIPEMKQIR